MDPYVQQDQHLPAVYLAMAQVIILVSKITQLVVFFLSLNEEHKAV